MFVQLHFYLVCVVGFFFLFVLVDFLSLTEQGHRFFQHQQIKRLMQQQLLAVSLVLNLKFKGKFNYNWIVSLNIASFQNKCSKLPFEVNVKNVKTQVSIRCGLFCYRLFLQTLLSQCFVVKVRLWVDWWLQKLVTEL